MLSGLALADVLVEIPAGSRRHHGRRQSAGGETGLGKIGALIPVTNWRRTEGPPGAPAFKTQGSAAGMELTITRPDDWHLHLRDGDVLASVAPHTARQFGRAIIMPNLAAAGHHDRRGSELTASAFWPYFRMVPISSR